MLQQLHGDVPKWDAMQDELLLVALRGRHRASDAPVKGSLKGSLGFRGVHMEVLNMGSIRYLIMVSRARVGMFVAP